MKKKNLVESANQFMYEEIDETITSKKDFIDEWFKSSPYAPKYEEKPALKKSKENELELKWLDYVVEKAKDGMFVNWKIMNDVWNIDSTGYMMRRLTHDLPNANLDPKWTRPDTDEKAKNWKERSGRDLYGKKIENEEITEAGEELFSIQDSILDGFTIETLIDVVTANEPTHDRKSIIKVYEELMRESRKNARETFLDNIDKIESILKKRDEKEKSLQSYDNDEDLKSLGANRKYDY